MNAAAAQGQDVRRIGILGGMGPAAGAELARLFVEACEEILDARGEPVRDQAFPEHVLLQVPFADRTAALLSGATEPLGEHLGAALQRLAALGVDTVGMACNTAHAWHAQLQARNPALELLNVGEVVAAQLQRVGVTQVGLLATTGTYLAGVYDEALRSAGIRCVVPELQEREALMRGIYDGVKAGDRAQANVLFTGVADALCARHGLQALILGCTEIPLALRAGDLQREVLLLDPAALLAQALAQRAYGDR
jgi:aspartate racemase